MAKRGDFIILRKGLQSEQAIQFEDGSSAEEVSKSISFGWYEAIFKYLRNKPVKVVSSMGEQSCGKSYLLNHFIGTSFYGSAMVKAISFIIRINMYSQRMVTQFIFVVALY